MTINYKIHGNDLQYIQVSLAPGEKMLAEQGAMMYVQQNVDMKAILGDGSQSSFGGIGRFINAVKRRFTGESMFSSVYTNEGMQKQDVTIAAPSPGEIVPIDLDAQGGTILCQKGAYLAGEIGQKIQLAFQKSIRVGLLGGEGFIMQKIMGKGTVFIHASGTLKEVELSATEKLKIDTGCLVGMSYTVRYDIKYTGSLKTSLFGGEGLFYATVSGPGRVWIQSLPINRLSNAIFSASLAGKGKGSIFGKLYLGFIILFVIFTLVK